MTTKTCTQCHEEKSLESFSPHAHGKLGRHSYCKACNAKAGREWHRAHPDYGHQWEKTHREQSRATAKAWRDAHPDRCRAWDKKHHLKQYGLTPDTFAALLASQGGGCAACGGPPNGKGGTFHVDHDHDSGRVRGLLCHSCNTAIGLVKENPERLQQLIEYLERHRAELALA